jgi:hypothetical protein
MTSFVVHFPDGVREFHYPAEPLKEGDVLWHEGERYRIVSIAEPEQGRPLTVIVEPDSGDLEGVLESEQGGLVLAPVD